MSKEKNQSYKVTLKIDNFGMSKDATPLEFLEILKKDLISVVDLSYYASECEITIIKT
jgi:hypothetical protein